MDESKTNGSYSQTVRYGVIREEYTLDGVTRVAYGIAIYDIDTATVLASVGDISADRAVIEEFALRCDQLELAPLHLLDAVEDLLVV